MATQLQGFKTTIQALEDLSAYQYHAIALDDGKKAANGKEAGGIILNKPKANEHAELGVIGEFKFRAGEAITAGTRVRVTTNGWFVGADSGYYNVGRALVAVTSGSIGRGLFDFSNPVYQVSSL